jgi:hypothetical protein
MYNHSTMRARGKRSRWVVILVLAALGFTQASLAFSGCQFNRAALSAAMRSAASDPCYEADTMAPIQFTNRCFAHCTADLQTVGSAVALVRSPADSPVLILVTAEPRSFARIEFDAHWPGAPPPRILFRTLLI